MKKTILHIIDNLGRGGAETMLVNAIRELPDYHHIVVTLHSENEFGDALKCDKIICLHLGSVINFTWAAIKLRRIIAENKPAVVHSHLFWSTIIARIGTPKKIPLISTIHTSVAQSAEYRPQWMRLLEKITYNIRKNIIIAVSKGALDEYFNLIKVKPYKKYPLYTFVDTKVFNEAVAVPKKQSNIFRLITVGNLKGVKNHDFLLNVLKDLQHENISLDIYGKGPLQEELQKKIDALKINVVLKGQVTNIETELKQYDLFVMSSLYEGFSVSVLEAMALGMPLLLTDITSFKEQCEDTALYFSLNDPATFIEKLQALKRNTEELKRLGLAAKKRVLQHFTLDKHIEKLKLIYSDAMNDSAYR